MSDIRHIMNNISSGRRTFAPSHASHCSRFGFAAVLPEAYLLLSSSIKPRLERRSAVHQRNWNSAIGTTSSAPVWRGCPTLAAYDMQESRPYQ